ncbi:MAG TPA: RNA polymerase sigma factor [Rubrivivax sp.]|nr:RNA polymerase sigma factor [Rubrivivax sp.]
MAGDTAVLAVLYEREAGAVYRYALALCGNSGWAADAVQEAFVALASRPAGFDASRGALGAYLAGVARHALAAQRRELRLHDPWPDSDDGHDGHGLSPADGACPETLLVRAQDARSVWSALRQLPAVFREAIVLVDLQERPYAEAAQIAGIELNTLRTRLHRARLKLAVLLGGAGRSAA